MRFEAVREDSGVGEEIAPGVHVLRFVRHFPHPAERVWTALTTPSGLRGWFADATLDLTPGGAVELRSLSPDASGEQTVARGRTAACVRPRLVEYEVDPYGRLRFELASVRGGDGDGGYATRLGFTDTVAGDEALVRASLAGWHVYLDLLGHALDGRPFDWRMWETEALPWWRELHSFYTSERAGGPGAFQIE